MYQPDALLELTGFSSAQFEKLLLEFDAHWRARYADRTVSGEPRLRKLGGGHPTVLDGVRAKFFFILIYARFYPSQEAMAAIFGLSQGQVSHWIARLTPVAVATLRRGLVDPARRPARLARLVHECPDLVEKLKPQSPRPTREFPAAFAPSI